MTYLAVVAYPDDFKRRDRFIAAVRSWSRIKLGQPPKELRRRDIERCFDHATEKINSRLAAREIASLVLLSNQRNGAFFIDGPRSAWDAIDSARSRKSKLTIVFPSKPPSESSKKKFRNENNEDANRNDFKRIWQPSKPVLNLADALWGSTVATHRLDSPARRQIRLIDLIADPTWVVGALDQLANRTYYLCIGEILSSDELIYILSEPQAAHF